MEPQIVGLGDDNRMYRWEASKAKWELIKE